MLQPRDWAPKFKNAIARGEIVRPGPPPNSTVEPAVRQAGQVLCAPTPTTDDIFPFEDSDALLLSEYTDDQLIVLFTEAANALIATHGDNFDFIGIYLNFTASRLIGSAFYFAIVNDVEGIGDSLFNERALLGLASGKVQGYTVFWDINNPRWSAADDPVGRSSRLVWAQEFEHRFALFLPPLLDGRPLNATDQCGRLFHWNHRVDGQGSGMEMREWVGAPPGPVELTRGPSVRPALNFNTDIGGIFSLPDLYLMGYVSPQEMDAWMSEFRYMDDSPGCASPYTGNVGHLSSADIIATAGERLPSADDSQKNYHTGWVMIHLPGDPPSAAELDKAAGISARFSEDWNIGTLGRGTMNNTLGSPCQIKAEWRAVSAVLTGSIRGNEILVPAGGTEVTIDLMLDGWGSESVSAFQITLDASGYQSGTQGSLTPVVLPSVADGAFIDRARGDYVFAGLTDSPNVDTSTPNYRWSSAVDPIDSVSDPGHSVYAGTLKVNVPAGALGTFTLGFQEDPAETFVLDAGGVPLPAVALAPVKITIVPTNTSCASAEEIACDSTIALDNSALTNRPNPAIGCASGVAHDGSVWFQFTATEPDARVLTCDSEAPNSTLAVYDGTCDVMTELACGEDEGCGLDSDHPSLSLDGLTPGETYMIQLSAFQRTDRGAYLLSVQCSDLCPVPPPASADVATPDLGAGSRNRFLSFSAPHPGLMLAARVTLADLPPPFDVWNGAQMWVGPTAQVSENGANPAPTEGFPNFTAATLQCTPVFADWNALGVVNVFHEGIVPGGTYHIALFDQTCGLGLESNFSPALAIRTAVWGDTLKDLSQTPPLSPDGSVNVVDALGVLGAFRSAPGAITKSRADLEPGCVDLKINVSDVLSSLAGFVGLNYPFAPSAADPCDSACPSVLP